MKTILLDIDGVLADFTTPALALIDLFMTPAEYAKRYNKYNIPEAMGVSEDDFWLGVNTSLFWEKMELFPWALDIYQRLAAKHEVYLVTSHTNSPETVYAKAKWIKHNFAISMDKVIFIRNKMFLAGPGRVLLDDNPENVINFRIEANLRGNSSFIESAWQIPSNWNYEQDDLGRVVADTLCASGLL